MPFCGVFMAAPAVVGAAIAHRFRALDFRQTLAVLLGVFAGALSFYLIYKTTGAWESFRNEAARVGGLSIRERLLQILHTGSLHIVLVQRSVCIPLGFILLWIWWRSKRLCARTNPAIFAPSLFAIATVLVIGTLAQFSPWYGWLYMFPFMTVYVVFFCDHMVAPRMVRQGVFLVMVITLLCQNVFRHLSFSHLVYRGSTDPKLVQKNIEGQVTATDVVLGDASTFIAIRPNVSRFYPLHYFLSRYSKGIPLERTLPRNSADSITVVIVNRSLEQQNFALRLKRWCGGEWTECTVPTIPKPPAPAWLFFLPSGTQFFEQCNYRIYRRIAAPANEA
jgi:hypothetical protein